MTVCADKSNQRGGANGTSEVGEATVLGTRESRVHGEGPAVGRPQEGDVMGYTKPQEVTATKLQRITRMVQEQADSVVNWLMPHYNVGSLTQCFQELDGRKALGVDQVSKEDYGRYLEENLSELIAKMKTMSYHPGAVREVLIPKEGKPGAMRPLGIGNFEDKIVQLMTAKILGAIYEPLFLDCSYGFRPGRNCHQAVRGIISYIMATPCTTVIDVDLANYFGTLSHQVLLDLLGQRIKDQVFLRYVARMLKAGVMRGGELSAVEDGSPQGNVASPVLANIYAHYVIDVWFEEVVKPHCRGTVALFRYCDDLVVCCQFPDDAKRILEALAKRLAKYSLAINRDKSRIVSFSRWAQIKGTQQGTFDFLGFTFYLANSRGGKMLAKVKTSRKRLRTKLAKVKDWVRRNRNIKMVDLWRVFILKIQGHIRYFAVSGNLRMVQEFVFRSTWTFFRWMNRRSQKNSFSWTQFSAFIQQFPLPKIRVQTSLYRKPTST